MSIGLVRIAGWAGSADVIGRMGATLGERDDVIDGASGWQQDFAPEALARAKVDEIDLVEKGVV